MSKQFEVVEIDCLEVRRELVNYMEGDLDQEMRSRIDRHLMECSHCTAIYDGVRNVVQLVGKENAIELPAGFSRRLYERLMSQS